MDKIEELLTRGVENIIPGKDKLRELLNSGKKLNIFLGIDPTSTKIHVGHAVPLRKLQAFAELGHNVTFLIGDFTALVGDTSDKESERPAISPEQINENFQTYKKQASKVLDFSKIKVVFNREWLKELKFADIIKLTQHFSAGDFFNRELIKKRLNEGKHVGLHEVLYPVMQGYDSYHLDTDIQLGGTDQTYNMQAGRILLKDLRNKESFIIANGFLEGTDGRKMSKTWNNAIWLEDAPDEMFGKIMSLRDELIIQYFTLATNTKIEEIMIIEQRIKNGENPMVFKKELAVKLVTELHSAEAAQEAQLAFEQTFQQHKTPTEIEIFNTNQADWNPVDLLVATKLAPSKSEAKRLIEQSAVEIDSQIINPPAGGQPSTINLKNDDIIKVGKRRFIKIIISN